MESSQSETSNNSIENHLDATDPPTTLNTTTTATTTATATTESSDFIHSDTEESHTLGRPSPPPPSVPAPEQDEPPPPPTLHNGNKSSSPEIEGSLSSNTRSKKRAIDTMLEEEGKEGDKQPIDQERQQQPPPLPKRQTPPAGIKSKIATTPPSPPSRTATFIDQPLFSKGDRYQEEVAKLLELYRQHDGMRESSTLIFEFLDKWIKETKPNAIIFADALFELLLENYNPATDERLVSRICLVMSQILQRKCILR